MYINDQFDPEPKRPVRLCPVDPHLEVAHVGSA